MPSPRLGSQAGGRGMSLQEPRDQHRSRKQACMSILCGDWHEVTPASAWGCHLAIFTGKLNLGYFSPLAEGCSVFSLATKSIYRKNKRMTDDEEGVKKRRWYRMRWCGSHLTSRMAIVLLRLGSEPEWGVKSTCCPCVNNHAYALISEILIYWVRCWHWGHDSHSS